MAGESARAMARQRREKSERLARAADAWERGAEGEQATAEVLDALPGSEWAVFHDLRWPGRRYANIDHVAVGPGGVFVIDSKNWSGTIAVKGGALRQNGRARTQAVTGVAEATVAIGRLVPSVDVKLIWPVLCFARDERVQGRVGDVRVCSTVTLLEMLTTRKRVWTPDQVRDVGRHLDLALRADAPVAVAAPARRTSTNRRTAPASRRRATRARKKSSGAARQLITLAVMVAVIALLVTRPDVVSSLVQSLAELLAAWMTE